MYHRFFFAVCFVASFQLLAPIISAHANDLSKFNGKFEGELKHNCRPGPPYIVSGKVNNGDVTLKVIRGKEIKTKISVDGKFKGEAFLRPHKRGDKLQRYSGEIQGNQVRIEGWYGVEGEGATQCTSDGKFKIHALTHKLKLKPIDN